MVLLVGFKLFLICVSSIISRVFAPQFLVSVKFVPLKLLSHDKRVALHSPRGREHRQTAAEVNVNQNEHQQLTVR